MPVPSGASTTRSPIVIASVGTTSGPVGAIFRPAIETVQAWTAMVNDRGGINGHPVRLLIYDDAADPARHRAQVQDAVENQGVIAFVENSEALTGRPSVEYITTKRIPVIGGPGAERWYYESPMYFPQASGGDLFYQAALYGMAGQVLPQGKKKLGGLFCVEAQPCEELRLLMQDRADDAGLEYVYQARSSINQPDFTAECLGARNAKVEVFFMGLDTNSVGRVASSCARQGYRPIFSTVASVQADRFKDHPDLEGMVVPSVVFPYFQSGTPATDEYEAMVRTYGKKIERGTSSATGWVAAKLFEIAARGITEPPRAEAVLKGLWTLRQDGLGGLTRPLTFIEGRTVPVREPCWFLMVNRSATWSSPDNYALHCRPDSQ